MDTLFIPAAIAIVTFAIAAIGPEWSCIFCRISGFGNPDKHRCLFHDLVMSTRGDDRDDAPDGVRILATNENNNQPPAQDPPQGLARALGMVEVAANIDGEVAPLRALFALLGRRVAPPIVINQNNIALEANLFLDMPAADDAVFLMPLPALLNRRARRPLLARLLEDDPWNLELLQPAEDVFGRLLARLRGNDIAEPMLTLHQVRAMVFTPAELYTLWDRAAEIQIQMGIQGVKEGHANCERCGTGVYNMEIRRRLILSGELRHGTISREDASPLSIPTVEENEAADKQLACSICLCDFEKKEGSISKTNCGHYYHNDCINQWSLIQRKCPNCVRKLV